MAGISMMQKLLDNALTSKFAKSLKHSDLPEGWADNPEIVQLAKEAYEEMATESPWFKARFADSKAVDEAGEPLHVFHGSGADDIEVFRQSKTGNLGPAIYTTPDVEAAKEFAKTHDGAKVYELFVDVKNPLKISNSLEAVDEFWGKLAGKSEADAIADLHKQGYDSAWAIGAGKSRWGDTAPEIAVYSPFQVKSVANRGTFNPDDPNIYKGLIPAVGAGGMLALLGPEEAEASPYQFPAEKRGTVLYEPGLESPVVDPADILTAPIGAVGAGAKAVAMAAEPFLAYGMDKAMDYIGKWWGE